MLSDIRDTVIIYARERQLYITVRATEMTYDANFLFYNILI